jgi:hypothetical protein
MSVAIKTVGIAGSGAMGASFAVQLLIFGKKNHATA